MTYNPYNLKDFQGVKNKDQKSELPRGLGSNVGSAEWQKNLEKREKEKKYAEQLRSLNKRHGLLNAERKAEQSKSPPAFKDMAYRDNQREQAK